MGGTRVQYATIWQHRPLVLVCLADAERDGGGADADARYIADIQALGDAGDAAVVITRDPVAQVARPAALVADRWGEIFFVRSGQSVHDRPPARELAEWLHWVRMKCPECEGETR